MKNPRQLVAEALLKVDGSGGWSNLVLDNQLLKYQPDSRDSAFISALFYGVLERSVTLDACIAAHSRLAPGKLSPPVREAVRIALYQLLYMEGVPDHAAVSESVDLVKRLRKAQAAGFVNGVLRSFLRADKQIPVPKGPLEEVLSVEYSCPAPLVRLWLDSYGEDSTRRILAGSLGRPPLYIRVNTLKITTGELTALLEAQGITVVQDEHLPDCLRLEKSGAVQALREYKKGFFHVQDKASQLCVAALDAQPGQQVLDACAAPGGKSFTIAECMGGTGKIVSVDIHEHRAKLIADRAKKMGLHAITTRVADMTEFDPGLGEFDRILCDVPCSGLGAIRRKPEIKRKPLEEFAHIPSLQYKILQNTAQYCKAGGLLIYSTCTLNPAENTDVVERFLGTNPDFVPGVLPELLGGGSSRTILDEFGADGFFIAAVRRR